MHWTPVSRPVLGLGRLAAANSSGIFLQPPPAAKLVLLLSSSFPLIVFDLFGNFLNKITPKRPLILF